MLQCQYDLILLTCRRSTTAEVARRRPSHSKHSLVCYHSLSRVHGSFPLSCQSTFSLGSCLEGIVHALSNCVRSVGKLFCHELKARVPTFRSSKLTVGAIWVNTKPAQGHWVTYESRCLSLGQEKIYIF